MTTVSEKLDTLIEANIATKQKIKWGNGERVIIDFFVIKHQLGKMGFRKLYKKIMNDKYIEYMTSKEEKKKQRAEQKEKAKEKSLYVKELTDKINDLQSKKVKEVNFDLSKISVKRAAHLIKQNIHDMKLGIKLDNGTTYFLNDKTMNQIVNNKIEDEHMPDGNRKDNDYQEVVKLSEKPKSIKLFRVEAEKEKK